MASKFQRGDRVRGKDGQKGEVWKVTSHESGNIYCYITSRGNACAREEDLTLVDEILTYSAGDIVRQKGVETWTKIESVTVDEDGELYHLMNGAIVEFDDIEEKLDPAMD